MEYNDKVPAPCEHRVKTAFNRMLQPGGMYEVQLIGLTSCAKKMPMYHVFQSPDLKQVSTLTIHRKKRNLALVKWHSHNVEGYETSPEGKELDSMIQDAWLEVPITFRSSDADILYGASEALSKLITASIRKINNRRFPPKQQ